MTAAALSNELKSLLTRAGVENPSGDAGLIIENVLGMSRIDLMLNRDKPVEDEARSRAVSMARRRASGEPIQYILGSWPFMGRDYSVGEGVLIPRDDTEVVVRAAIELMKNVTSPAAADLCSGSGVIAVTLYHELSGPRVNNASVAAVEKSPAACAYLRKNIKKNSADIRVIEADIADCADLFGDGSLDLIISNPPYIRADELPGLQSEVRYEPAMALDGGESGLDFYELIIRLWTNKLKNGGYMAFELGEEQYEPVAAMLKDRGYTDIKGYKDIQGTVRAVTARL